MPNLICVFALMVLGTFGHVVTASGGTESIDNAFRHDNPEDRPLVTAFPGEFDFSPYSMVVSESAPFVTVTIGRFGGSEGSVTVDYLPSDGVATGGSTCTEGADFINTGGTVTFAAGQEFNSFTVPICPDSRDEFDEAFYIHMSNPTGGATIRPNSYAVIGITDDDDMPSVFINDVEQREGSGGTTALVFTIGLSAPAGRQSSVGYGTSNGTAVSGSDFTGFSARLATIDEGESSVQVTVIVNSDFDVEPDETLYVNITSALFMTILDGQGVGTIINDDANASSRFDYDGDGRSDISVFRGSTATWYLQQSTEGYRGQNFGTTGDKIVPADYDGDGRTDIAVYRPSTGAWYVINSSTGAVTYSQFGIAEDLPTPADYDGDRKADISVFRPSTGTWYRQNSSNGAFVASQFGAAGDRPTIGDFDGDNKVDIAVFRPSTGAWYQTYSSNGFLFGEQFGISTDKITQADYDGDGKTDIAIYRPSEGLWYVKRSATNTYVPYVFGLAADIPTPGDFDGDGKADIGVFRPSDGTWYIVNSTNGSYTIRQFGQSGDVPTLRAFGN